MFDEKSRRGAAFRQAYWQRAEELVGLLGTADQEQVINVAKENNLGRKTVNRFKRAAQDSVGLLSLEEADKIAKRYALWTVRRVFDWGDYPPSLPEGARRIDEELCGGIYDLDVRLRREIEKLVLADRQDSDRASQLRSKVEGRAGALAAALEMRHGVRPQHEEWERIAEEYDKICNELDRILTLAGSPPDST